MALFSIVVSDNLRVALVYADFALHSQSFCDYHVKNSKHLSDSLSTVMIEEDEVFASHDVVSLFTNTPIDKALIVIRDRLENNKTLKKRAKLSVQDIMGLIIYLDHNIFHFQRRHIQSEVWYRYRQSCFSYSGKSVYGVLRQGTHRNSTFDL